MLGGKQKQPLGYTIVEVMIVLAVSGIMFLIAAQFIAGKQQKTAFTTGVNSLDAQIQSLIEQVIDGRYSDIPLSCSSNGVSTLNIGTGNIGTGSNNQGTNQDCLFIGKFIQFGASFNLNHYNIFTLADARLDSTGQPVTGYPNPYVTPIDITTTSGVQLTTQGSVPDNIQVIDVLIGGFQISCRARGQNPYWGFGFLQGLGIISNGQLQTGAPSVVFVSSCAAGLNRPTSETTEAAGISKSNLQTIDDATVCLSDGTYYATIHIGSNHNRLTVDKQIVSVCT